jgi:hypothetical protein
MRATLLARVYEVSSLICATCQTPPTPEDTHPRAQPSPISCSTPPPSRTFPH